MMDPDSEMNQREDDQAREPRDDRAQDDEQRPIGEPGVQGDQSYGLGGEYGESGTLAEGFGQGQTMAEDQWADQPRRDTQSDIFSDDVNRMRGGMMGDAPEQQ